MPTISGEMTPKLAGQRMNLINEVESHLMRSDIHVLKFYLHISKKGQGERIEERKALAHKRWKYSLEDDKAHKRYGDYEAVYNQVLEGCNIVPWHIVPSDKRWYRNFKIAEIVVDYLSKLELKYPNS